MSNVRMYTYLVKQDMNLTSAPVQEYDLHNLLKDAENKYIQETGRADRLLYHIEMFGDTAALIETLLPPERFNGEVAYLMSLLCEEKGEKEIDTEESTDESFNYEELEGYCVIENGDNLKDRFAEINAFNRVEEAKSFFNRRVGMFGGLAESAKEAVENPECRYFFTGGYRIMIEKVKYHKKLGE